MDLPSRFRAQLASLPLPGGSALVAVSGGLDSVVLLDLLRQTEYPARELVVAHVDHGIHPQSAAVAGAVYAFAAGLGLRCEVERLELGPGTGETTAREARYRWLFALREQLAASLIFTAHHGDDQAETVLMRALAGSGPGGLAGIPVMRGVLVRPLLPFRRQDLTRYARERGLPVWVDPANSNPAHLRSWVRCDLLPTLRKRLPDVDDRLRRLGKQAARERAALDQVLDLLPGLDPREEAGGISVAASPLAAYDSALAQTLIIGAARRAGLTLGPRRAARAWQLVLGGDSGREVALGEGWRAELSFGRLRLVKATGGRSGGVLPLTGRRGEASWGGWRIRWRPDTAPERQERSSRTAWFSGDGLVVRPWAPGDKVRPLAGTGRRLVVRCFQDARVPRRSRGVWPVLTAPHAASPDVIVWIPGVCRSDALLPPPGAEALRVDVEHA